MGSFNKFLNWSLRILFLVITIGSGIAFVAMKDLFFQNDSLILSFCLYISTIILIFSVYYALKNKYKKYLTTMR